MVVEAIVVVVSTHSRPKAAGRQQYYYRPIKDMFQHTVARRRLEVIVVVEAIVVVVSTHSRPKAAGSCFKSSFKTQSCFNTQSPEGGWVLRRE